MSKKKNKKEMLRNLLTTGTLEKEADTEEEPVVEEEIVIDDVAEFDVPEERPVEVTEVVTATAVADEPVTVSEEKEVPEDEEPAPEEEIKEPVPVSAPSEDVESLKKEIEALRTEVSALKANNEEYLTSKEQHKAYMAAVNKRDAELANKKFMTMLEQLCAMREDFFKLCNDMEKKLDKFSPKDVLGSFTAYSIDMENILADAGVQIGKFDYEKLNTLHQRIVDVIPTDDESLNGMVAERMSDGYEFEGRVLFKEKVKIYKFTEQTSQNETIQNNKTEKKGEE